MRRAIFSPDGMVSHREDRARAGRIKGEESRNKVIELLTDVGHSQTQMVNNYSFLMSTVAGAWHVMTVP